MKLVVDSHRSALDTGRLALLVALPFAIGLAGCAINRGTIHQRQSTETASSQGIILIDAGYYTKGSFVRAALQKAHQLLREDALERQFYLVDRKVRRTTDGRLNVYFLFENTYRTRNWLDLQVVFYDEDHRVVETTTWEVREFPKSVKTAYDKTSLSPAATGYELYVRDYR